MNIEKISINNFYSIKSCEIDFTKYDGIVQVLGKNKDTGSSNGAGKSTLFESVVFGLFGRTIRKSTEEAMVNCDVKKGLKIELSLSIPGKGNIKIVRTKKPTSLELYVNDRGMTQDSVPKTQATIEGILGIDYKTFLASFVFGQHVDLDFLSATPDEKRGILRSFLNLEEIFSLRDSIRNIKSDLTSTIKVCDTLLKEYQERKRSLSLKLNKSIPKSILLEPYDVVSEREARKKVIVTELKSLSNDHSLLLKEIASLNQKIKRGTVVSRKICGECGSETVSTVTERDLELLSENLILLKDRETKILRKRDKLSAELKEESAKMSMVEFLELKELDNISKSQKIIRDELAHVIKSMRTKTKEKKEASIKYEVMRFWEKGLSEQGLIRYFIQNILEVLNEKVNEYLSLLTNNQFILKFDEELTESIVNNGRAIKFISLSGGEKRKVNLSVMLALQSVLRQISNVKSNLIFFDEITENIDEDGALGIHNLLAKIRGKNTVLFLITHNSYLNSLLTSGDSITMIKARGETTVR